MRMDSSLEQWQELDSAILDIKSAATVVFPPNLAQRTLRRESVASSVAGSSITASSISSAASAFSKATDVSKAPPTAVLICTRPTDTLGSFAPTTPVSSSLRALLPVRRSRLSRILPSLFPAPAPPSPAGPEAHLFVIPAICRTASSGPLEQSFAVPAFLSAPIAQHRHEWTPIVRRRRPSTSEPTSPSVPKSTGLDPALAAAEDASRLRTQCVCTTCGKSGANFPRNPRTGDAWCSRQCRMTAKAATSLSQPTRPRIEIPA